MRLTAVLPGYVAQDRLQLRNPGGYVALLG
jgi:hypothetical protein